MNDAPALKKADIGIAVDDSTDAARSASDIVLTEPGLSVIISAVLTSRAIFQRMKNYTVSHYCSSFANEVIVFSDSKLFFFLLADLCCFNYNSYCGKYLFLICSTVFLIMYLLFIDCMDK